MAGARMPAVGLVVALLALLAAAPASALPRTISWASPHGPGGPFAQGVQMGVEFSAGGDVCGARRVVINTNSQAVSTASTPDGSKVFFSTEDKLVAADTDGQERDIYEFSGGLTKLVTVDGGGFNSALNAYMVGCAEDGSRVFFTSDVLDLWEGSSSGVTTQVNVRESPPGINDNFPPRRAAFSEDGTTVALDTEEPLTSDDADTLDFDVFERSGGDTKLVSELTGAESGGSTVGGISEDGSRIHFTSADQLAANDPSAAQDLYVRVNDADPVVVSVDPDDDLAAGGNSFFQGATEDGMHVYFRTSAGIDNADSDGDLDLYDRNAVADTTSWISKPDPGGADDGFSDVAAFSQDGARVFFSSSGALTTDDVDGTTDFYLRTESSLKLVTKQIAGTAAGHAVAGCNELSVIRGCASTDATRIFFSTPERLTTTDTDTAHDIYRFTAPDGPVQLVSGVGPDAIFLGGASENGQRALFLTADRLIPCLDNDSGGSDVYEWDNGALTLVSRPFTAGVEGTVLSTMSADAATVFFVSNAQYAGSGNDGGLLDLFAARPGGTAATCPGPAKPPIVGTKPLPKDVTAPKAALSGARTQKAGRSVAVTVGCDEACVASASGTVSVPGAAKVFKLGKAKKSIRAGGKARLKLKVSKKARKAIRKALRRKGKVRATIKLTIADALGNKSRRSRKIRLKS